MFYKKGLTFILILYTLKKNKEVLMNKTLTFITTVIFFLFSFCGIFWLQYNKNLSNKILKETTAIVEKGVKEVSSLAEENPVILKKINSLPLQITYFRTKGRGVLQRHNFAGVTFKNMSPLLCHFIIKNQKPFQMRFFVNNEEKFFGSSSSCCFKKLNNDIRFYFEIYNYSPFYHMQEPKLCLSDKECDNPLSSCVNGYCKKTNK